MKFENTGLESYKVEINRLDEAMADCGMVRAEQWDYERVTYDKKFEMKEGTYYLRVQGYSVEGDVGKHEAIIQLITPLLGKHYYPHGVEYGEGEHFPTSLLKQCEQLLSDIKTEVDKVAHL